MTPITGSSGPVLTTPPGVSVGDALVCMAVYEAGPGYSGAAWPDGVGPPQASVFYATSGNGYFAEYSNGLIFGNAVIHDGRTEYVWTAPAGDFAVHYAFVPRPNVAEYPNGGGDDALFIIQTWATMSEVVSGNYTSDVLRWDGGWDGDSPKEGPLFDAPDSPSVWVVKFWSSQTGGNTSAVGGVIVEDAKQAITCPASITPGFCEYQPSSLPNPATGPFTADASVWWETTGIVIHSLSSGLAPLRQNQRDDIRQGQRTSRQLTVRQVGYL